MLRRGNGMLTYSLTLWFCRGCNSGLFIAKAGVVPSEEGKDMLRRVLEGLKGPGEEAGVVFAVRRGSWAGPSGGRLL